MKHKYGQFNAALVFIAISILGLTACKPKTQSSPAQKYVGIAMPTQSTQRWNQDGGNMKTMFEQAGYKVDLQFGEDIVENQIAQIENMITKGVNILIIAPIDGDSLADVVDKAAEQKIPVIAYDRLIRNTPNISYYATFDNFKVGVIQGNYIIEKMGLKDGKGPFNIELFGGDPADNNAGFFYNGAMSVLQPYIDNGQLRVKSGQTGMDVVGTPGWSASAAQARMDNILTGFYSDGSRVDIILAPADLLSYGLISSVKSIGYGSPNLPIPLITGQDAEIAAIKYIISGEQAQTIFKDTRELAKKVVEMVEAVLSGRKAEVNDTSTYDNGKKVVESYLLEPVSVDINNYKEILVDSGYYTEAQLR
jgi:putative multiple sugar transport system substrate-binding protein